MTHKEDLITILKEMANALDVLIPHIPNGKLNRKAVDLRGDILTYRDDLLADNSWQPSDQ